MNPQLLMQIMQLLGGSGASGQQQPNAGASNQMPDNTAVLNALQGFSPVNVNPNYGSTVSRFFNKSPLAGAQAFTGAGPLQPGRAGNNAQRGGMGHSSFMPTDFANSMQKWIGP